MTDDLTIDFGTWTTQGWTDYELVSDILTPADGWSVSLPLSGTVEERQLLKQRIRTDSGCRCFIYIRRSDSTDRALQLSGIVDDIGGGGGFDGAMLHVRGRDNGGLLAAAHADPAMGIEQDTSLLDAIRTVCAPFGISVTAEGLPSRSLLTGERVAGDRDRLMARMAREFGIPRRRMRHSLIIATPEGGFLTGLEDSADDFAAFAAEDRAREGHANSMTGRDVERIRVRDAKPAPGETCWSWIDRQCRRFGVMPWIGADGKLIISAPHYDQEPLFRFVRYLEGDGRNNIVAGGFDESIGEQSSSATVYGRGPANDATRSRFRGFAERNSSLMPLYRPLVVHDPSIRSQDEATRRAKRELAEQNVQAFALEYEVYGHGQGPYLYAVDTMAEVVDEQIGVSGLFWMSARTFKGDRERGKTTKVRLIPEGALTL